MEDIWLVCVVLSIIITSFFLYSFLCIRDLDSLLSIFLHKFEQFLFQSKTTYALRVKLDENSKS